MSVQEPRLRFNRTMDCFELRCDDCRDTRYWPITVEFWMPGAMTRCRACQLERRARRRREAYRLDPERHRRELEKARAYKASLPPELRRIKWRDHYRRIKSASYRLRYASDPEFRERVLERNRARRRRAAVLRQEARP